MTIEELVADMRDIHTPPGMSEAVGMELAVSPFVVLGVGLTFWLVVEWWRQQRWRREGLARLCRIHNMQDPIERWTKLVRLAQDLRSRDRKLPHLPDCVYIPGNRATKAELTEITSYVKNALRWNLR